VYGFSIPTVALLKEFYVDPKNFDEFGKKMLRGELVNDYPSRLLPYSRAAWKN